MKRSGRRASPAGQECYATAAIFAALFRADVSGMFHLALLLTEDPVSAERCLVAALDDCVRKDSVFVEYAPAYARYAVIRRATKATCDLLQQSPRGDTGETETLTGHYKSDPLLSLPRFERAVFILCLLERFSDKQASLLLGATPEVVRRARIRGLEGVDLLLPGPAQRRESQLSTPRSGEAAPSPEGGPAGHLPSKITLAGSLI